MNWWSSRNTVVSDPTTGLSEINKQTNKKKPKQQQQQQQQQQRQQRQRHTHIHVPSVWNNLPQTLRHSDSASSFKAPLKTHLLNVSRFGLAVRRLACKRKGHGSIPLRLSFLFRMVVVCGLCPSLPTETLKWLSSLPILMRESFWW